MISVPLISKDQVIGVLNFRSTKPNIYSEADLRLAERVGNQIAGAIANAQLYAEVKRAEEALQRSEETTKQLAKENAIVAEIGRIVSSTLNIEEVYEKFLKKFINSFLSTGLRSVFLTITRILLILPMFPELKFRIAVKEDHFP